MDARRCTGVVAVTVVAGCASATMPAGGAPTQAAVATISLVASRINSGEVGRATLVERDGRVEVTIWVSGVPSGYTRPVHLYTYIHRGSCAALSAAPEHALTERVLPHGPGSGARGGGPFELRNTAPVPLAALQATPHAIVVKGAPADRSEVLFCGDVADRRTAEELRAIGT
jgi:hypothetical protein